tara:strand:- start:1887 stop:2156 length:270 start_codon:yes stop_codon:yes gene_type:complete
MIEAGVLFIADTQGGSGYSQEDMLLKVYCQDERGNGVQLRWYWRPEAVVMMAMANPNTAIAVDVHKRQYTGTQIINIITASRDNDYTQV